MKRFLIVVLCAFCFLANANQVFSAPLYSASVNVYDQNGQPLAGVPIRMEVFTTSYWSFATGTTNSNGFVYLSLTAPGFLEDFWVSIYPGQDYVILSSQNTYTSSSNTLYPRFDVGLDSDGNDVIDGWELPLAEKFCPTMVTNPHLSTNKWLVPEPVEIVTDSMFMKRFLNPSGNTVDDIFLLTTENWDYSWVETLVRRSFLI